MLSKIGILNLQGCKEEETDSNEEEETDSNEEEETDSNEEEEINSDEPITIINDEDTKTTIIKKNINIDFGVIETAKYDKIKFVVEIDLS